MQDRTETANSRVGPLVTVGMIVRNEARHLRESLQAICDQTYANLEILVSDNASDDGTQEICREFAERDSRVVFNAFSENVGVSGNFDHVLTNARGEYFLLAAGHDLWSADFVEGCVRELTNDPEAVLAFGENRWIDANGTPLARRTGHTDTRGLDRVGRFFTVLWGNMHPIYGVMRLQLLRDVSHDSEGAGADLVILERLALKGHFAHAVGAVYVRRSMEVGETYESRLQRYRESDAKILAGGMIERVFPVLRLPFRLLGTVYETDLPLHLKIFTTVALLPVFLLRYLAGRKVVR